MATTEIVTLSDDLDSRIKNDVETVTFYHPVTGVKLEIELGEANRKHLSNHIEKLQKYIDVAREVEVAPKKAIATQKSNLDKVRVWARENGYEVGDRGRIKADILNAYAVAQEAIANPDTDAQAAGDEPVSVTDGIVDETDLVEVEFPQDESREVTEDEFLALLGANPDANLSELRELASDDKN